MLSRETSDWSLKRRSDSLGDEEFEDFEEDKDLDEDFDDELDEDELDEEELDDLDEYDDLDDEFDDEEDEEFSPRKGPRRHWGREKQGATRQHAMLQQEGLIVRCLGDLAALRIV